MENNGGQNSTIESLIKTLSKFNFIDHIDVDIYIDVIDNKNIWCVGKVIGKKGKDIKINYDGWNDSYNEVLIFLHNRVLI